MKNQFEKEKLTMNHKALYSNYKQPQLESLLQIQPLLQLNGAFMHTNQHLEGGVVRSFIHKLTCNLLITRATTCINI